MSEEYIDELVFRFQKGDQVAGEKLLYLFGCHPNLPQPTSFVGKYFSLIRYGRINFADKDTRRFLMLFMKDPQMREEMKPHYQYRKVKAYAIKTLEDEVIKPLSIVSNEDLLQDLREMFIRLVMRFKKKRRKIHFTGYLYSCYRYHVKNYVAKISRSNDLFIKKRKYMIRIQDDRLEDESSHIHIDDLIYFDGPMMKMDETLGSNWIRGLTCGEEFKRLTPLQRLILKLHYEDNIADGKIAEKMGMHINTIFRQRKKAQELVIQTVQDLIEEGHYS